MNKVFCSECNYIGNFEVCLHEHNIGYTQDTPTKRGGEFKRYTSCYFLNINNDCEQFTQKKK